MNPSLQLKPQSTRNTFSFMNSVMFIGCVLLVHFAHVAQGEIPGGGRIDSAPQPKSSENSKQQDVKFVKITALEKQKDKEWGRQQPVDKDKMIEQDPHGYLLKEKSMVPVMDMGLLHAFVASLSVIIVSELGDKTFFIAAIMAMRHPRLTVFAGAMAALGLMTVLSAMLGYATTIIPRWLTYYVSSALFALFGIKMLKEGYSMDKDEGQEELEEVQADLRKKDEEVMNQSSDAEVGAFRMPGRRFLYSCFSRIFLQSFALTFLAEWGDRSQIATIILAARDEVIGVIIGGTLGHALCTSLAVMGGRFIAQRISIKTVHLIGGVVFLIFAVSAFFIDPDE